jgi:hypothetical protein
MEIKLKIIKLTFLFFLGYIASSLLCSIPKKGSLEYWLHRHELVTVFTDTINNAVVLVAKDGTVFIQTKKERQSWNSKKLE